MFNNNPDVKVTHVDCQTYDDLCRMEGVNAYPTIRLYPMGSYGKSQWRYVYYISYLRNTGRGESHFELLPAPPESFPSFPSPRRGATSPGPLAGRKKVIFRFLGGGLPLRGF